MSENPQLSERELEILRLVATGASNKEIASQLVISANTVKVHLRNIFNKLEVSSRTEATMWAVREGIVDVPSQENGPPDSLEEQPVLIRWIQRYPVWIAIGVLAALIILVGIITWQWIDNRSEEPVVISPELDRWQEMEPMYTARYAFGAATYAGDIYAIAGEGERGVVGVNERYDFVANEWDRLTPKPIAVADVQAVSVGGKIYVPGGRIADGSVTDVLEIYDPGEDRWELGAALPMPISAYALVAFEGKIYLFGGWDGEGYLNHVYVYSPDSNTWERGPNMPTSRGFASAAVVGEKILVVGGTADGKQALSVSEAFSPEIDLQSWKKLAPIPEARFGMGAASIAGTFYMIGGEGEYNTGNTSYVYYPQQDEWLPISTPIEQPLTQLSVLPLQTHLFFIGGRTPNSPTNQNLSFQAIYTISIPIVR